jgi:hypothetical protein
MTAIMDISGSMWRWISPYRYRSRGTDEREHNVGEPEGVHAAASVLRLSFLSKSAQFCDQECRGVVITHAIFRPCHTNAGPAGRLGGQIYRTISQLLRMKSDLLNFLFASAVCLRTSFELEREVAA